MKHPTRLLLDRIGHRTARFHKVVLDFADSGGSPLHTVLWLRNGGGKTSLLNLAFSVMIPHARQFIGRDASTGQPRELGDYVGDHDTAHIAFEWSERQSNRLPGFTDERWVTGVVMEWPGRTSGRTGDLDRLFYAFKSDTRRGLTFDTLPVVEGEDRLSLAAFRDALAEHRRRDPSLQLVWWKNEQEPWRRHLAELQLDPVLFEMQATMNRREGGVDAIFSSLRDSGEFVDFLLDLAYDPASSDGLPDAVDGYLTSWLAKDKLRVEHRFLTHVGPHVSRFAAAGVAHAATRAELSRDVTAAAALSSQLSASAEAYRETAEGLTEQRGASRLQASTLAADAATTRQQEQAARRCHAELTAEELGTAVKLAQAAADAAEEHRVVWEASEHAAASAAAAAQVSAYDEQLASLHADAEPALRARLLAATRLTARLRELEDGQRTAATQATAGGSLAEEAEETARSALADISTESASLTSERSHLQGTLDTLDSARKELVKTGLLVEGQTATTAAEALEGRREAREAEQAQLHAAGEVNAAQQVAATSAVARSREALAAATDQHREASDVLRSIDDHAARLGSDPLLGRLADGAPFDVWDSGAQVRGRLTDVFEDLTDEFRSVTVDLAIDGSAIEALREGRLLPPDAAVRAVVDHLSDAGIEGFAGVEWLAANRPDTAAVRAAIERYPHLVAGVVVQPQHLDDARRAVANTLVDRAVTVAAATAFDVDPLDAPVFVVAPTEAVYDRSAIQDELDVREIRWSEFDEKASDLTRRIASAQQLATEIDSFLAEHPVEQVASAREEVARLRAEREEARKELSGAEGLLSELVSSATAAAARLRDISGDLALAARSLQSLAPVVELERSSDRTERRITAINARLAELAAAKRRHETELAAATARVGEFRLAAASANETAAGYTSELSQLARDVEVEDGQLREIDLDALPPVDALRDTFRQANQDWLRQVTDDDLLQRRSAAERVRRNAEQRLAAYGPEIRTAALDLLRTVDGADAARRADRLNTAAKEARDATVAAETATNEAKAASDVAAEHAERLPDPVALPRPVATSADAAELADELDVAAEGLEDRAGAAEKETNRLTQQIQTAESDARALRTLARRLDDLLPSDVEASTLAADRAFDGDVDAAEERVDALASSLADKTRTLEGLRDQLTATADDIRAATLSDKGFDTLESEVVGYLRAATMTSLLPRADEIERLLAERATSITHDLDQLNETRGRIARMLADEVKSCSKLLSRAERTSTLPKDDKLGPWSETPFIRIRSRIPTGDELVGRLTTLIDELAREAGAGKRPEAERLIRRAVHAAAGDRGFSVEILRPNDVLTDERIPIEEAKFSGGQGATAAIIIYCTAASLRASSFRRGDVGGPLILDNPFANVNNLTMVELPRIIADKLNVQLIYATGVHDEDVIGLFGNVVRLRNSGVDRRTGDQHVEVADRSHGRIATARVFRNAG